MTLPDSKVHSVVSDESQARWLGDDTSLPSQRPYKAVDNISLPSSAIVEWQCDPGTSLRISNIAIQFQPGTSLRISNASIHC